MTGWAHGPLLGFDTETTGVDPASDRIVAAALVHRDASGTSARTWLVDPGVEIPAAASAVHGITTEQARAAGSAPPVALEEVTRTLVGAWAAGVPVVAFNAAFDLAVLDAELRRHGLTGLGGRPAGPVLDPLALDRGLERYRPGSRRLADLCAVYGVPVDGDLHTAEVDAVATLDVLAAIAGRHPSLARMPAEQVHAWQAALGRARRVRAAARPRGPLGPAYTARRERLRAERATARAQVDAPAAPQGRTAQGLE